MLFSVVAQLSKRKEAELMAVPFWEKQNRAKEAAPIEKLLHFLSAPLESKDFKGKEGEVLLVYGEGEKEPRFLLVGLGKEEKLSIDSLRRSYSSVVQFCLKKEITKINLVLPNIVELRRISVEECLKGVCEGILLSNYQWHQKTVEAGSKLLKSVTLIGVLPKMLPLIQEFEQVVEGVNLARDLINGNADIVTPHYLAETAKRVAERFPQIKTTVFDKKRIEKEKMGLLLAVSRGSPHEPAFIQMHYQGNGPSKDHTILIGKGITYDTGGLNLKPATSMETMRDDMSGAAAVIGTLASIAALRLKVNVTGVIPAAENAIDGNSFKLGDVYTSFSGKTIEIGDTDAEGRLVLADAISYTVKNLKPTRIIDLATLTGSMMIALGEGMAGFLSNDDSLSKRLMEASVISSELLWRLPLHQPYKELLKSSIADIRNVGGRFGGAILASLFMEEFVEGVSWAHLDIAGTAFGSKPRHYLPKYGVGFGVRLLVEFLRTLAMSK